MLGNLGVAEVHEVLVQLVGAGLGGVEPRPRASGLAELRPVGREEQRPGEGVDLGAAGAPDQVDPRDEVAPLV